MSWDGVERSKKEEAPKREGLFPHSRLLSLSIPPYLRIYIYIRTIHKTSNRRHPLVCRMTTATINYNNYSLTQSLTQSDCHDGTQQQQQQQHNHRRPPGWAPALTLSLSLWPLRFCTLLFPYISLPFFRFSVPNVRWQVKKNLLRQFQLWPGRFTRPLGLSVHTKSVDPSITQYIPQTLFSLLTQSLTQSVRAGWGLSAWLKCLFRHHKFKSLSRSTSRSRRCITYFRCTYVRRHMCVHRYVFWWPRSIIKELGLFDIFLIYETRKSRRSSSLVVERIDLRPRPCDTHAHTYIHTNTLTYTRIHTCVHMCTHTTDGWTDGWTTVVDGKAQFWQHCKLKSVVRKKEAKEPVMHVWAEKELREKRRGEKRREGRTGRKRRWEREKEGKTTAFYGRGDFLLLSFIGLPGLAWPSCLLSFFPSFLAFGMQGTQERERERALIASSIGLVRRDVAVYTCVCMSVCVRVCVCVMYAAGGACFRSGERNAKRPFSGFFFLFAYFLLSADPFGPRRTSEWVRGACALHIHTYIRIHVHVYAGGRKKETSWASSSFVFPSFFPSFSPFLLVLREWVSEWAVTPRKRRRRQLQSVLRPLEAVSSSLSLSLSFSFFLPSAAASLSLSLSLSFLLSPPRKREREANPESREQSSDGGDRDRDRDTQIDRERERVSSERPRPKKQNTIIFYQHLGFENSPSS